MNKKLTVFTTLTASYQYSEELKLSFEMVRSALPDAEWVILDKNSEEPIKQQVSNNLPDTGDVLFIREPAVLMTADVYPTLKAHLNEHAELTVILPSDMRGHEQTLSPNYHTLRGYERFISKVNTLDAKIISFDNRAPWAFLTDMQRLAGIDIPDDPFDLPLHLNNEKVAIALNAYVHPFLNYYSESRPEILDFVPKDITSLLDVGCSRGGFAASVKDKLNCRVAGVEMNEHEAMYAKNVLDHVWVGNINELEINETFDCVSCLDVLEHVQEPQVLLKKMSTYLKPEGKLVLSVPNVGFWAIVEDLLAGRWDYVPAGILCNTHVRFFTEQSLCNLLESCGFTAITIEKQRVAIPSDVQQAFEDYRHSGLEVNAESLETVAFTVVAEYRE